MSRTIKAIEAELQQIKYVNPDWMSNKDVQALITSLTQEKNLMYQQQNLIKSPKPVSKRIFVIFPPTSKHQKPQLVTVSISSEEALEKFSQLHRGSLVDTENRVSDFQSLIEDGTYTFSGSFYQAIENDTRRRQVDDLVLELESALALKTFLGTNAHIHPNVKFMLDQKPAMEIDAVVHVGGENVPDSTAYIVESAYSPQPSEVEVLSDKVNLFNALKTSNVHFSTVTKIVPVLAGRNWPPSTIEAISKKDGYWRIAPSGSNYQVFRSFTTFLRKVF